MVLGFFLASRTRRGFSASAETKKRKRRLMKESHPRRAPICGNPPGCHFSDSAIARAFGARRWHTRRRRARRRDRPPRAMGEEDAADPFDLLQPIPAKPKPAAVPDSEPKASSPGSGNGAVPMGPGANAQRDAMRDAIANKMDEMLGTRGNVARSRPRTAIPPASPTHARSLASYTFEDLTSSSFDRVSALLDSRRAAARSTQTRASSCTPGRSSTR